MEKLCIIIIGGEAKATVSRIADSLSIETEVIEIPFILAETNEEWLSWEKRKEKIFSGIGAGAAGCLIGHHLAWKQLSESDCNSAIILESDAILTRYGQQNLKSVTEKFNTLDWNILHLGTHIKIANVFSIKNFLSISPRVFAKEIWERIYLKSKSPRFAEMQFPFSTHGYLIKKEAAAFLLNQKMSFIAPVDVILNSYSHVRGNRILRCRTPLIIQNSELPSQINRFGR